MARRKSTAVADESSVMTMEPDTNEDGSVMTDTIEVVDEDTAKIDLSERAAAPEFFTEFVDELPANDRKRGGRGRGPSHAYLNALTLIKDNPGKWGTVARFHTATGATTALRNIKAKNKIVPDDVDNFEFETRRATDEMGKRYSVLFARYVG